jgi:hypothetical protein
MIPSMSQHVVLSLVTAGLLLGSLLLLLSGAPQPARADSGPLFVSPTGSGSACAHSQPCSLQTALDQATNGDTIYLAGGIYTGAGGAVVTLTKSVGLYGGWYAAASGPPVRDPEFIVATLDGQGERRAVYVAEGVNAVLDGLYLTNGATGDKGGGIFSEMGSRTTLNDCHMFNNAAGSHGGGAYFRGDATLTANWIHDNTAGGNGGGVILIHNGDTTLTGNEIYDNSAFWGGGVQTYMSDATLSNNDIYLNRAEESGGGANINETDGNHVALVGNRVYSNTAMFGGGVIVGNCSVTMTGNVIHDNDALQGAGLWFASGAGVLVNNVLVDNRASMTTTGAGGLMIAGSDVRMLHTTMARNRGGRVGGILVTDFFGEHSQLAMTNTILVSHTVGIEVNNDEIAALEATLWGDGAWANGIDLRGPGAVTTGTVNVWGMPAFVAPEAGDYHILAGSAAVAVGVDVGVTSDIDDGLRPDPVGTAPDIGADEVSQRRLYLPLAMRHWP